MTRDDAMWLLATLEADPGADWEPLALVGVGSEWGTLVQEHFPPYRKLLIEDTFVWPAHVGLVAESYNSLAPGLGLPLAEVPDRLDPYAAA